MMSSVRTATPVPSFRLTNLFELTFPTQLPSSIRSILWDMSLLRLLCSQRLRQLPTSNCGSFLRRLSAQSPVAEHPGETQKRENLAISHARFVAEAGQKEDWPEGQVKSSNGKVERDVQATRQGELW